MINTLTIELSLAPRAEALPEVSVWDPRILLAAQQVLGDRPCVTQAPDLLPHKTASFHGPVGRPVFAVALDDHPRSASMFDSAQAITTLVSYLTETASVRLVFAEDGGWKVTLVDLDFSVVEL